MGGGGTESDERDHDEEEAEEEFDEDDADYTSVRSQMPAVAAGPMFGRSESIGKSSDWELVFSKDNVCIHPNQSLYASSRISGRLRVLKQASCSPSRPAATQLFLSWIPYKTSQDGSSSDSTELQKDRNLYTIKALPFSDVRFIRRHMPTLGWPYIIIVLSSGLAFPPLYFYSGGLREFLGTLKLHIPIARSADDPNVIFVNDFQDPLQKSLSSLELHGVVPLATGMPEFSAVSSTSSVNNSKKANDFKDDGSTTHFDHKSSQRQKPYDPARDFSIQVLEKFSVVTKFARDTTSSLFRENSNSDASFYGQRHNFYEAKNNSTEEIVTPEKIVADQEPIENDKAALVWGKERQLPLSTEEWHEFLDSEGRVMDSKAFRKRVFYGGVEHGIRKEVWKFLLGYHDYDSTFAEREYLSVMKKSEYEAIKSQWKSISTMQAKRFTKFRERKGLIEKDVVRTDRSITFYDGDDNANVEVLRDILLTYSFYNFDLGYCQGMSDFLSPILYVIEDEAESFWCFTMLMERLAANFNRDQNGMHSQLLALSKLVELLDVPLHNYFKQTDCLNYFFCFRWILIQFKREFDFVNIMYLWEVLWTHYLSEHFHLYMCVAILKRYRKRIIDDRMDFDTLLKFINELSGQIDLNRAIQDAEALCSIAGDNGVACIPAGTPPSLPTEIDNGLYVQEDEVL